MKLNSQHRVPPLKRLRATSSNGFTLLEVMVVLVIIGILFAIAAPSWNALLNRQRLNTAQEQVYLAMRDAQSRAKLSRIEWRASFREQNGIVQWAVHPAGATPSESFWHSLDSNVRLDPETTLQQKNGVHRAVFTHKGHTDPPFGRITLSGKTSSKTKRCVIVSTYLGALRKGEDQPKKDKTCD